MIAKFLTARASNVIRLNTVDTPTESRDSAVGIAADYGLDDQGVGVRVPVRPRIFISPCCPDWLWDQPSLLSNGHQA
jgi:hypothetical protein